MNKKIMSIVAGLLAIGILQVNAVEDWPLPDYYPDTPSGQKQIKDYTVSEIIGCYVIIPEKLNATHPYRLEGVEGLQQKWGKEAGVSKLEALFAAAFEMLPEDSTDPIEDELVARVLEIMKNVFVLTPEEKVQTILKVSQMHQTNPKKRYGIRLCAYAAKDLLDMRLLKYASQHFDDKEVRSTYENEGGGKIIFYYATSYGSWIRHALREMDITVPREIQHDLPQYKAWLDARWDEFEQKSVEVLKNRVEKEVNYPPRKYLPREAAR